MKTRHALDTLRIGADGSWIAPPGRTTPTRLPRRSMRKILLALCHRRASFPGEPMTIDELVEAAWPGERMRPCSAKNRVYVSIALLRRLGLGHVVVSDRSGYWIASDVAIERLEPAWDVQASREPERARDREMERSTA